jgi:hypothetical protein
MNARKSIVYPGQKVITTAGKVVTVAFVNAGQVYAYGRNGLPEKAVVCGDAFGGEHDQVLGLVA